MICRLRSSWIHRARRQRSRPSVVFRPGRGSGSKGDPHPRRVYLGLAIGLAPRRRTAAMSATRDQHLIDRPQTALPRLQRNTVTLKQQSHDVAAALEAVEAMATLVTPPTPLPVAGASDTALAHRRRGRRSHAGATGAPRGDPFRAAGRVAHGAKPTPYQRERLMQSCRSAHTSLEVPRCADG